MRGRRWLLGLLIALLPMWALAAPQESARGALSPSAPIRLDYDLPDPLPDGGTLVLPLAIRTPVTRGQLHVEVARAVGVTVTAGEDASYTLAGASQPIRHSLQLALGSDGTRYVVLLLTIDADFGTMSRSFRIDLSPPAATSVTPGSLKLMPSTRSR